MNKPLTLDELRSKKDVILEILRSSPTAFEFSIDNVDPMSIVYVIVNTKQEYIRDQILRLIPYQQLIFKSFDDYTGLEDF